MRRGLICRVAVLLIASASLSGSQGYAQSTSATVAGQITDQSGKVVPGASVLFTNVNTGVSYAAQSKHCEERHRATRTRPGVHQF
jgi:hypothetical protein